MTSDEHRRFITGAPPGDGLARLAVDVGGPGARVIGVRRLRGGVDASTRAVLDWNEVRLAPAACDVAYCSIDLAMSHGVGVAQQFVGRYRQVTAREPADLVRWQLLWIVIAAQWLRYWQTGFELFGLNLPSAVLRRRLGALADRLLTGAPGGVAS